MGSAKAAACALQNPKDAKAASTSQNRLDGAQVVPTGPRLSVEPLTRLGLAVGVAECAPLLVGLGAGAAGDDVDEVDDLLVEDHDAVGRVAGPP